MRILIAEDDPISCRLLQRNLEKWGHEVVVARNGTEAWEKFQQEKCPIVISDWMMPGIDGPQLLKRIRQAANTGYIYTILLTAKYQKSDLIHGMESGADDFLTKPFDAEELKVRLRAGERIVQLEQHLAEQNRELEDANLRMRRNLQAAVKIQEAMLPSVTPRVKGADFAWCFNPCDELAGDIFNILELDESHVGLYVLDVSGHGVPAALWSVMLSRILSADPDKSGLLIQKKGKNNKPKLLSPAEVANQLNKQFQIDTTTGQFFTFLYGILDLNTRLFRYVSAGHPDLVYIPQGKPPKIIETPGFPIGFNEEMEYDQHEIQLRPGDRIVLYSDGVVETRNASKVQFGKEHLAEIIANGGKMSLQQSLNNLMEELEEWAAGKQFDDDITILGMEVKE